MPVALTAFVRSGVTAASEEHRSTGRVLPTMAGASGQRFHRRRSGGDVCARDRDPLERVTAPLTRAATCSSKYGLAVVATRNPESQQVRLSARALT